MNYVLPKVSVEATSLVVADMEYDRMDGQIAACVLQGIVNRTEAEKIYILNTYCIDNRGNWQKRPVNNPNASRQIYVAELWLDEIYSDLEKTYLEPADDKDTPMFLALLEKYHEFVKGIVIFDPALPDATIEAATTIAAQTDSLVVSPELAEKISSYGFPLIIDLRDLKFKSNVECLTWLKENYFSTANHSIAFTWSHMTLDNESWGPANKDYVVAHKLFTFYLDIFDEEERSHYKDIICEYPMGTPVYGWTDELVADQMFCKMGYFMVPYIGVENLTVASSFPAVEFDVPEYEPVEPEEDAIYITFHVADGDNLLHSLVYEPNTVVNSPKFGEVPATWILNPAMADLHPRAMKWYRDKLLPAGQEPAAMIGDGHPSSERYKGFRFYCDYSAHYMKKSGMTTIKQMVEAEAVAWNVRPGCIIGGYSGFDDRGIDPDEFHLDGDTFHIGSISLGETDIEKLIEEAPEGKPYFLCVFSGTAATDVCSRISKYAKEWKEKFPNKKIRYITAAQAADLARHFAI